MCVTRVLIVLGKQKLTIEHNRTAFADDTNIARLLLELPDCSFFSALACINKSSRYLNTDLV
jgi:hypothetical protein